MSSHLKSEGIYANSYEDCLATLFVGLDVIKSVFSLLARCYREMTVSKHF